MNVRNVRKYVASRPVAKQRLSLKRSSFDSCPENFEILKSVFYVLVCCPNTHGEIRRVTNRDKIKRHYTFKLLEYNFVNYMSTRLLELEYST